MNRSSRGTSLLLLLSLAVVFCTQAIDGLSLRPLVISRADEVSLRLPNNTSPIRYDIFLTTRIDEEIFTYNGVVDIQIVCLEATSTIVLHNRISVISKVSIKSGATTTELTNFETNVDTEFLTIQLDTPLVLNQEYTLSITFVGEHGEDNIGWSRASYTNDEGEVVWFATTDFQAPNARQAFPCYDEPDKKAIFRFEITNNQKYHALSNMPTKDYVVNADGTATSFFNDTPLMSTYLLALVVSDFDANCKQDEQTREHCVYARPNALESTDWALEVGTQGLVTLEKMLDMEYSLPKMDQIAIPNKDFGSRYGAMENWGLVKYRESQLLFNETADSYQTRRSIASVVLHEFAMQYFGDLVTPKWWTYSWLKDGFGTLLSYYATDKLYPTMRLTDILVLECIHDAMDVDAILTRPMTHYEESNAEIANLFNYVPYMKGATILRMMMLALGEETFYKGLQYYLQEMQFKNAVAEDLFVALQKASDEFKALPEGLTIETIMNSWTLQAGYPLITAKRDSTTVVTLTQNQFTLSNPATPLSTYYIPITFTESRMVSFVTPTTQDWFKGDAVSHQLTVNAQSTWYILNKQQSSYYRVNYDENNWRQLALTLNNEDTFKNIHLLNRAQLLDDSLDLALNGRLNATIAFDVLRYLTNETDYIPWAAAEEGLTLYFNKMKMSDNAEVFNVFLYNMTKKLYTEYGAVPDPEDVYFTHLARNRAIHWACLAGSETCQKDAGEIFELHQETGAFLDPNYSDVIPCAAARSTDEATFDRMLGQMNAPLPPAVHTAVLDTLICSYNADFLEKFLNQTLLDDAEVNLSDAERMYIYVELAKRDVQGLQVVLEFFLKNSVLLIEHIPAANTVTFFNQIAAATYSVKLSANLKEVAKVYEEHIGSDAVTAIDAQLATNLAWMEKEGDMIIRFLTIKDESGAASTIVLSSFLVVAAVVLSVFRW